MKLNRRDFMKLTGGAAAVAAVPKIAEALPACGDLSGPEPVEIPTPAPMNVDWREPYVIRTSDLDMISYVEETWGDYELGAGLRTNPMFNRTSVTIECYARSDLMYGLQPMDTIHLWVNHVKGQEPQMHEVVLAEYQICATPDCPASMTLRMNVMSEPLAYTTGHAR